ncbi:MAG: hypothetical protein KBA53_01115 [Thermoclostridium sp.]|nr:hypothetical protein [Thermoclostridium sp.]
MHVHDKEYCAYLERSMPAEKQERLKEHFSDCGQCNRELNEWESLFDTIGMLNFDFSLDGLEEKVMQQIRKAANEPVSPRILASYMVYVMAFLFIAGLFINPALQVGGQVLHHVDNHIATAGLRLINEVKWHAVDIISYIRNSNLFSWLFALVAGITLIAGGTYVSFGSKLRKANAA